MTAPALCFDPDRHRRGGRPRLPEGEQRSERVVFRATPSELARIEAAASAALIRRSDYIRTAALADDRHRPRTAPDIARIATQLLRAGNNLNQLARAVNAGLLPPDAGPSIDAIREDFRAALHRLANAAHDTEG